MANEASDLSRFNFLEYPFRPEMFSRLGLVVTEDAVAHKGASLAEVGIT